LAWLLPWRDFRTSLNGIYRLLIPLHNFVNITLTDERGVWQFSRMGVVLAFAMIGTLTTASRFASFKVIQWLHRRGVGNRNVLIYGTSDTARRLQKKFVLVPTLGLNLIGFVSDKADEVGRRIDRFEVIGVADELEFLIRRHKISEVFVAVPEADEQSLLGLLETLERNGHSPRPSSRTRSASRRSTRSRSSRGPTATRPSCSACPSACST
jgi:FlaA1/EpsC-like NDP-sugar epimerase